MAEPEDRPADANEGCVGPSSEAAGRASACAGCPNQRLCASGELRKPDPAQANVVDTMSRIGRTILVLSGKGGVGKSTTATQLALALARAGKRVGLLDLDICGPSVPHMLGLTGREVHKSAAGWSPVYVDVEAADAEAVADAELGVMSIGFLMPDQDSAVIWRGPRKSGLIQQFFTSVDWGELDYLLVDTPPGTSDEHISVVQLLKASLKPADGAVVVTTPQEVAMLDVRKELSFCKQTGIRVLGVVENMSAARLPADQLRFCDTATGEDHTAKVRELLAASGLPATLGVELALFPAANGGPEAMAQRYGVPLLGRVPMDTALQQATENGVAIKPGSAALGPLSDIVRQILATEPETPASQAQDGAAAAAAGQQPVGTGVVEVSTAAK